MSAPCPALGFHLALVTTDAAARHELERALRELLDREGLRAEPTGVGAWVVRREGSQTTDADRELVARWLEARGGRQATLGPIVDLGDE